MREMRTQDSVKNYMSCKMTTGGRGTAPYQGEKAEDCIAERRKNLDIFDALGIRGVYAQERKQNESAR